LGSAAPATGPSAARTIAARVLAKVWQHGAFAMPTLDKELRQHGSIAPRDAALATELVYGVLRTAPVLEQQLDAFAHRQGWKRRPLVKAHLLIGAYTIAFLDRIPAFAAVSEAVTGIKEQSDKHLGGFANAVLRKLVTSYERNGRPDPAHCAQQAIPQWLRELYEQALGAAPSAALMVGEGQPPPIGLRLGPTEDREDWLQRLRTAAPTGQFEAGELAPRCILARSAGDLRRLPGAQNAWVVQEQGAQVVALLAGGQPGEIVLDACAGRGSKALVIAEQIGEGGRIDLVDRRPRKMAQFNAPGEQPASIGHHYAVDWSRGSGDVPRQYDRAIVDAPCTGSGTLRRRPEIAYRLQPADVARLSRLQVEITRRVAGHVRDGGRLIYAVCSLLRQEAEQVVEKVCQPATDDGRTLEPVPFDSELGQQLAANDFSLRLLPEIHGTDGYFIASLLVRHKDGVSN